MTNAMTIFIFIKYAITAFVAAALSAFVYHLSSIPIMSEPSLGHRGLKRRQMLEAGHSFRFIEPFVRLIASWISRLPIYRLRSRLDNLLIQSGDSLGITPDETIALMVISAASFTAFGAIVSRYLDAGLVFSFTGLFGGGVLPFYQLQTDIRKRFKQLDRKLPAAIDLAALCMGAGLDFPGALKLIVENAPSRRGVVEEEFSRILQELEVGHTRKQALEAFAQRTPTDAVKNFVGAVVQAEEKGNPLAEVLQIQAQVLRMHRSVAAEEAAARAGVMMMIPLFLLLCCILLVLFGPFIVNGIGF
jgi:tight adherence protein C